MYHKISDMCDKISVIKRKAEELHQMKYSLKSPKEEIDMMIADIQQLCREVGNDTGEYQRSTTVDLITTDK